MSCSSPAAWSSQRHWHEGEDEFVVMLEGEAVLVEEEGETILRAGDCAVFPKDVANGHHLVNRSDRPCAFLAVGCRHGDGRLPLSRHRPALGHGRASAIRTRTARAY